MILSQFFMRLGALFLIALFLVASPTRQYVYHLLDLAKTEIDQAAVLINEYQSEPSIIDQIFFKEEKEEDEIEYPLRI